MDDRRSCSGNVIFLAGGPISWQSKKQKSVALSMMEAEYMALSDITREVIYIRRLLIQMQSSNYVKQATQIYCDNQCAITLSRQEMLHRKSKHIDICFHFSREAQEAKEINIKI